MRFARKSPSKELISCPACGHEQKDYPNANVTYCHKCGHRIELQAKTKARTKKKRSVEVRHIHCLHCRHELAIHAEAQSWQCNVCSTYIDLRDHEILKENSASILTYGNLTIGPKAIHTGARTEAENIHLAGRATNKLVCRSTLVVQSQARMGAGAEGEHLFVPASASLYSDGPLVFRSAEIHGPVEARQIRISGQLEIHPGGHVTADFLETAKLKVAPGGKLLARCQTLKTQA